MIRLAVGLTLIIAPLSAQRVDLSVSGLMVTHNEVAAANRVDGFGAAGGFAMAFDRIDVDGVVFFTSLSPVQGQTVSDYSILEGQVHGRYALTDAVGVELGYIRRRIDPAFAAQDLGAVTVGARLNSALTSQADMYVRGGFAALADFSGGGSAGLSYQVGFGVHVRPSNLPFGLVAEYDFQRFGRTVRSVDVPIQMEAARIGARFNIRQ